MDNEQEEVLVVRSDVINEHLNGQTSSLNLKDLKDILKSGEFNKRYLMEIDQNYKQIIPYVGVVSNDKVLVYMRSKHSGETRLHDSYSIGVGGHIDKEDDGSDMVEVFFNAAIREIKEEIGVECRRDDLDICCFINDNSNDVGRVHVGVGLIFKAENIDIDMGELDIVVNRMFMDREEVEHIKDKFENWSQIFYENHVKDLIK